MNPFTLLYQTANNGTGWAESVSAMEVSTGCVLQVAKCKTHTGERNSLALVFVPGVRIVKDEKGNNRLSPVEFK